MKGMKKQTKGKIIFTAIFLALIVGHLQDYEYHPEYEILEDGQAYACYRDGDIYIGDEEYLKCVNCKPGDVLICDTRNAEDSNFKIYDSYHVTDKEARNDIIEVLLRYEEENPSNWNRTKESMRLEWYVHNLIHDFTPETDHSTDVDLNNSDEQIYDIKVLRRILKL